MILRRMSSRSSWTLRKVGYLQDDVLPRFASRRVVSYAEGHFEKAGRKYATNRDEVEKTS